MATTDKPDVPKTEDVLVTETVSGENVNMLAGMDVRDKSELIGVPFDITGLKQTVNERHVAYVWCEIETLNGGEQFVFNDSSTTGVRGQLLDYLASIGKADVLNEWTDTRIRIPRGLRRSEFDTKDERGKDVKARTFYLTTAGRRA